MSAIHNTQSYGVPCCVNVYHKRASFSQHNINKTCGTLPWPTDI